MWKRLRSVQGSLKRERRDAADLCIYAIGDVHGRFDLLAETCLKIDADVRATQPRQWAEIFLGDYVDRGPDSSLVLSALSERSLSSNVVCLQGNHEVFLLQFLANPGALASWRQFGGLQTLMSYGLSPSTNPDLAESHRLAEQLRRAMPAQHAEFLQSLPTSYALGRYFFAHAGVKPGVALHQQRDEDLLWIRDEFLLCEDDFGKVVVHGHTPVQEPEVLHNRINIDTGAYATGRLTCIRLQGKQKSFL